MRQTLRTLLLTLAAATCALTACVHSDPPPARMERPGPPEAVKNDPNFAASNAEWNGLQTGASSTPPSSTGACVRTCPSGQRCVLEQGLEKCVSQTP